jgi:tetratricopeptide (TPR) repeat protein
MRSGQSKGRIGALGAGSLIAAMLLLVLATGCSSLNEHMNMKDGAKAYKAGKFAEAATFYKTALNFNPNNAENWKNLAYCYWQQIEPGSNQPKDVEATTNALNAFGKYLEVLKKQGQKDDQIQDYIINLYVNQNRLDEGIRFYEASLKDNPTDPRLLQTLSLMYAKKGDFAKSLEYSEKKAAITPNDPSGYLYIGALCWNRSYNKQDPDEERAKIVDRGMKALETALRLDPNNFNGHLFVNLLYRQKADLAKSAALNEKDRRKAKELMAQSDEYIKLADQEKDKALAIRKAQQQAQASQPSGAPATGDTK